MPPSKEQSGTPGFLPIFWDELPHKSNLTSEFIYYSFFAGDGIIYTAAELEKAENVLTEYYDAWSELATQTNPIFPDRLPMVQSLANTSKICLVLKGMERPELLVHFFRCEQANVELPLPEQHLQTILKGNQYASVFAVEQYRVVRRPWNEGGHIEIPQREPLPLLFTHDYPSGSFGTVQCYTDVDSQERYARKEQITHDAEEHLTRERARLQKVNHRHVVQFVKSYRRGNCIGLLLKPAADGDLTLLLKTFNSGEMGQKLRPVILTAFGCLSHGLCHIHGRKIRHKDIKPNNILYRGSQDVARFLWADFGLAHDFGKSVDSRTFNASSYSARYAAPESVGSDQAVMDTEAAGLDDIHTTQDTNEEHEPSATAEPLQENAESPKLPAHGRSTDIFSYGCVFIEILSNLVNSKIPQSDTHGFAFCEHIEILQGWARDHAEPLDPADPLRVLFSLTARMIEHNAKKRPKVEEVVSVLVHSSTPEQFFCAACLPEARGESAAWLVAHETRQNNGGRISGESASIMSETSCLELEDEESGLPAEPVSQARFLSPAAAAKPRPAVRQSSSRLHQNEDEKSISEPRH